MNLVKFSSDSSEGNDCLLHVSMSGNKAFILNNLKEMVREVESSYGKPYQGINTHFNGCSHVITPIWNGEKY